MCALIVLKSLLGVPTPDNCLIDIHMVTVLELYSLVIKTKQKHNQYNHTDDDLVIHWSLVYQQNLPTDSCSKIHKFIQIYHWYQKYVPPDLPTETANRIY